MSGRRTEIVLLRHRMIGFLRRDSEGPLAGVRWNRTSAVANSIPSAGEPAMRNTWACLACMLLTSVLGRAADIPVLQDIDRRIPKQPEYIAKQPLFGLLVFGPTAEKRIWMVLDHSKPEAELYDLLYVDLNANGDLTEPTERLVGQVKGTEIRFRMPDLMDTTTRAIHTDFTARVSGAPAPTIMVSLMWRGIIKMGGGYPQDPEDGYLKFGDKPANAPVMRGAGRWSVPVPALV